MIKLGVFYCVENNLEKDVNSLKSFFKSKSNNHKYLNHLAHSTIYVFDIDSKKLNNVILEFENLQKTLSSSSSYIDKWKIFENDKLTGLNTLSLEIELTDQLKVLQMNVVKCLCKYHSQNIKINFDGDLLESYNKYGYPYVGKNWIPHITIGSLEISPKKIFDYLEGLFNFSREITINKLGLFKINGDSHELLKKIEF